MTASDTASSTARSVSVSGTGWPEDPAPTEPREARWGESRARAYRQLWQPPGRRPRQSHTRRQALGRPYVWDGGQAGPPNGRDTGRGAAASDEPTPAACDTAPTQDTVTANDAATGNGTLAAHGTGQDERTVSAGRTRTVDRPPGSGGEDALSGSAVLTERAVIGDELRKLTVWCQIGDCIARHTDAGALGEVDIRTRAVASGWCVDLFGRLICPSCQQIYPVWSARPAVPRSHAAVSPDRPGGWPVGGAGFQIGRHRRTYGAGVRAAGMNGAGAHGVGIY